MKTIKIMGLLALSIVSTNILPVYKARSERVGENIGIYKDDLKRDIKYLSQFLTKYPEPWMSDNAYKAYERQLDGIVRDYNLLAEEMGRKEKKVPRGTTMYQLCNGTFDFTFLKTVIGHSYAAKLLDITCNSNEFREYEHITGPLIKIN